MSQTTTPASPEPRRKRAGKPGTNQKPVPAWHRVFLSMLPTIIRYAKRAFRSCTPEEKQERVQNVVANSAAAVSALAKRGKLDLAYPTVLAKFGIRQTLDHRITGNSQSIRDVLSKLCQEQKGVKVERLDRFNDLEDCWEEAVVQDTRSLPVPSVVQFRLDFRQWLKQRSRAFCARSLAD